MKPSAPPTVEDRHRDRWAGMPGALGFVIIVAFVGFYAWYVTRHSDFNNDDLDNFLLLTRNGFWNFLATPNDVHHVPLHRALSWLIYRIAPMNFTLAVMVSVAFHVATIIYLYRLLRLLGAGRIAWLICSLYAMSVVPFFSMAWWAQAGHRFPYVFCAICAMYHYLQWLHHGGRRHIAICTAAFVLGFGFYEISVMIPAQMLVVAACSDPEGFHSRWRRGLLLPVALGLIAVIYVLIYLAFARLTYHASPMLALRAGVEFIKLLGIASTGLLVHGLDARQAIGWSWPAAVAAAFWLTLIFLTCWRRRRNLWLWLALLGLIFLDVLPIAVSNRTAIFGLLVAHQYRFTFENLFLVAIMVGLILRNSLPETPHARTRHLRVILAGVFVAIYGSVNMIGLEHAETSLPALRLMNSAHAYMHNLRHDLAQLPQQAPRFAPSPLPGYLSVFHLIHGSGPVVSLFKPQARIRQAPGSARYCVAIDGHVRAAGSCAQK